MRLNTTEEMVELIKAEAAGKRIEYLSCLSEWVKKEDPKGVWSFQALEYRVEPAKPRKMLENTSKYAHYNHQITHIENEQCQQLSCQPAPVHVHSDDRCKPAKPAVEEYGIQYHNGRWVFLKGNEVPISRAADYGLVFVHVLKDREIPNGQSICWRNEDNTRWSMWADGICCIPTMAKKVRRVL